MALSLSDLEKPTKSTARQRNSPQSSQRSSPKTAPTKAPPLRPWSAEESKSQSFGPKMPLHSQAKSAKAKAKAKAESDPASEALLDQVWSFSLRQWLRKKYQSSGHFYLPRPKIMRRII